MGGLEPVAQGKAWRSFAAQARMLFVGLHKYACFVERALFAEAQHFVKEASRPLRVLGLVERFDIEPNSDFSAK